MKRILITCSSVFFISACVLDGDAYEHDRSNSITEPFPIANIAPTAYAGADQPVVERTLTRLSGSGKDSDGSITSYKWTQTAGKLVKLTSAETASASFESPTAANAQILTFQLTVTDNDGAITADTINITVNPLPKLTALTLIVSAENNNSDVLVSWNDVSADLYRVLFWNNDGNVYVSTTTSRSLSLTSAMLELGGFLVVEAYDFLGNSVFSTPINVESL